MNKGTEELIASIKPDLKLAKDKSLPHSVSFPAIDRLSDVLTLDVLSELIAALEQAQHDKLVNWEAATSLVEENEELKRRLAELEARQLSVKLPIRLQPGADGPDDWYLHGDPDGEYMKADDVIEAIRAAGGQVEGE